MAQNVLGSALVGIDAVPISVQIDSNPGLHSFTIVGLGDKAIQESIERIGSAIKHSGYTPPKSKNRRYIVNLAPADLKKEGPGYDLPIAIAYLLESRQITGSSENKVFIGELSLDGAVTHTNGVLAAAMMARDQGASSIIVPSCNAAEASLVSGISVIGVSTLTEAVTKVPNLVSGVPTVTPGANWHQGSANLAPPGVMLVSSDTTSVPIDTEVTPPVTMVTPTPDDSFAYIQGQHAAKRAVTIGAAGGHNILMTGAPGAGKTILARSIIGLLPTLATQELIEVAKIHSAAGLLRGAFTSVARPFCSPHHTSSPVSVIGGGTTIRPGQVSLAHRGVLFLDEMPEFARNVLEALRQPLEDGVVTISRASGSLTLPAKFMLIGAMNPCPCGNADDPSAICTCTATSRMKYAKRISGPLLDRMDIQLYVPREVIGATHTVDQEGLVKARELIAAARQAQLQRFTGSKLITNSEISHRNISDYCRLKPSAELLLRDSTNRYRLSLRAYHKIKKVARTIADLECSELIDAHHVAEALTLRVSDRVMSTAA